MLIESNNALRLLVVLTISFVYAPVITAHFGYSDDFSVFFTDVDSVEWAASQGRPLLAYVRHMTLDGIENVDSLRVLRAAALVGVLGITLTFFQIMRCITEHRFERFAFCLALATLPSVQTTVAFAVCWHMPFASLLSCWAAILVAKAADTTRISIGTALYWLVAMSLVLASASLYQPGIMWYWPVLLIYLLDPQFLSSDKQRRKVKVVFASGLVFLVLCFLAQKTYFLFSIVEPAERVALTNNPFEKLYWFARIQMPLALDLWYVMDSSNKITSLGTACLTIAIILAGYFLNCRHYLAAAYQQDFTHRQRLHVLLTRTVLVVLVVGLAHTHWLVIRDSPQNYRIIAALAVVVWVSVFWSLQQLASTISITRTQSVVRRTVLSCLVIVAMFSCQQNLQKYWIIPYTTAYRFIVFSLRTQLTEAKTHIHVVRQGRRDGIVSDQLIDSFGSPLTHQPWTIQGIINAALKESGVEHREMKVTHSDGSEPIPDNANTLVIDMRQMVLWRTKIP